MDKRELHLLPALVNGGAERCFLEIMKHTPRSVSTDIVILGPVDPVLLREMKENSKLNIYSAFYGNLNDIRLLLSIFYRVLKRKYGLVVGWLYVGAFFSALARLFCRSPNIWVIHHNSPIQFDGSKIRMSTIACWFINAFSIKCSKRIFCSRQAMLGHSDWGGATTYTDVVVLNGISFESKGLGGYSPKRKSKGLRLGIVARYAPEKDFKTVISAVSELNERLQDEVCLKISGNGCDNQNSFLTGHVHKLGLRIGKDVFLNGQTYDIVRVYEELDILIMSSMTEGLPLVIGEALACGLPVISSDVGDVREYTCDLVRFFPAGDQASLVQCVIALRNELPLSSLQKARSQKFIREKFCISAMVKSYIDIFEESFEENYLCR